MAGKRLWILLVVFFLLLGVVTWEVRLLRRSNQSSRSELPEQLGELFDPVTNEMRFVVEGADQERRTLQLRAVFPPVQVNERYESEIICPEEDIKVVYTGAAGSTGSSALFDVIDETSKEATIFSGKCVDPDCREINRECRLFVAREAGSGL